MKSHFSNTHKTRSTCSYLHPKEGTRKAQSVIVCGLGKRGSTPDWDKCIALRHYVHNGSGTYPASRMGKRVSFQRDKAAGA
jgi:hypothetical protein